MSSNTNIESVTNVYSNPFYQSKYVKALRACDIYGRPIQMNFESKQSHQTVFGGFLSLIVGLGFSSMFLHSLNIILLRKRYIFDS